MEPVEWLPLGAIKNLLHYNTVSEGKKKKITCLQGKPGVIGTTRRTLKRIK